MHGKDYVLQIKVKNGPMLRAMKARGFVTASALARACGVPIPSVYNYLNLKDPPIGVRGEIKPSVYRIAECLKCSPLDLFPEQHYRAALKNNKAEMEVSLDEMPMLGGVYDPLKIEDQQDTGRVLNAMLKLLTPREERILRRRYGFDGPEETLREIGATEGVTGTRIMDIEAKAMRKLKLWTARGKTTVKPDDLEAFN